MGSLRIKHSGQVFTPDYLVADILDFCGYVESPRILGKHIIDNSCGEGAFLCEIVGRYCRAFRAGNDDIALLKDELQTYIHGIEIDAGTYERCIENLNLVALKFGVTDVDWDIIEGNALKIKIYDGAMDFVVGNPPYVRVHNLETDYTDVKQFTFANGGMTDLFLVFFELGLRMLSAGGRLCYITPSSWLNSLAGENMRREIVLRKYLTGVVDMGHFQPFKATTYTLISRFEKVEDNDRIDYNVYDERVGKIRHIDTLSYDEIQINRKFYISGKKELELLKRIRLSASDSYVRVKNGFATLFDDVFIGELPFIEYTIPVLKASTGKWSRAFFPYDEKGSPLAYELLSESESVCRYLEDHAEKLLKGRKRSETPDWFLYGRTQALKDVCILKYAVNTCIKGVESIKLTEVPPGCGLYSGLYILPDKGVTFDMLDRIIRNEEFIRYVSLLKNYKSGGYYTFNSKDLELYINYKIQLEYGKGRDNLSTGQLGLFESAY